jgi:hypothetical protein
MQTLGGVAMMRMSSCGDSSALASVAQMSLPSNGRSALPVPPASRHACAIAMLIADSTSVTVRDWDSRRASSVLRTYPTRGNPRNLEG